MDEHGPGPTDCEGDDTVPNGTSLPDDAPKAKAKRNRVKPDSGHWSGYNGRSRSKKIARETANATKLCASTTRQATKKLLWEERDDTNDISASSTTESMTNLFMNTQQIGGGCKGNTMLTMSEQKFQVFVFAVI